MIWSQGDTLLAGTAAGLPNEALREVVEAAMTGPEREEYDAEVARLGGELDEGALRSAWAEGRKMTADAAVAFALSE